MSNNTILGTKPFSDYMSVVEAASKIMKIDEHCGVCDEQGIKKEIEIEEAVLADKDYKYDGKVVKISKKNFSKVHKDFKNSTKGKERMMINDPKTGGSISVPVQFEEVEIKEAFFKVKIPDVAPTFVEASSEGAVKASMRKVLKPDVVADLEIEKVTPAAMKKMYRDMAQGKDEVGESVDESQELQAIMALDDAGIKATINRKDQVVIKKKDLKKAQQAFKKSFRKGGAPELHVEEVEIDEATAYPATIDTLRMIVKDKQHQTVMFKSGKAMVDLFTASAMVQVYDALKKPEMKKTFEKMITDKAGFLKTQAFAMKMLGGK